MSYRKAARLVSEQYLHGDPLGALQSALQELDKVRLGKRDADWHHCRGFCYYELDEADLAEPEFRQALQAKPDHALANLYLGHVLFDREEYAEALVHFLRLNEPWFQDFGQPWRILKNRELVLCCQLYTQPRMPPILAMEQLVDLYGNDPLSAPLPLEMVRCLDQLTWQGRLKGKPLTKWFRHLEDLVNVSGHSHNPSLSPALTRISESARAQSQ